MTSGVPYQRNLIYCACGCGALIIDRDNKGRLRKFIWGHQTLKNRKESSDRLKNKPSIFKGRHHTDECRKRMSQSHAGKPLPLSTRLQMSKSNARWNLGKHLPQATRQKISNKLMGNVVPESTRLAVSRALFERWSNPEHRYRMSQNMRILWSNPEYKERVRRSMFLNIPRGEKAGGWRGGLSFIPYTKEFNKLTKARIRERDNYVCQLCSLSEADNGKHLTIHHIDYDKAHSVDNNLISLCVICNTRVNTNRAYWTQYFNGVIRNKMALMVI